MTIANGIELSGVIFLCSDADSNFCELEKKKKSGKLQKFSSYKPVGKFYGC